jgi:histidinol-phosphate/aromatic aminotransferase/cobyric acid decarboxylase-like protein
MLLRPVTDANSLALKFSEYLLDNMPVVMNKINDFVAGRNFLYQKFCEYGLVCYPSHGNFLLLRCPSLEDARKIIDEAKKKKYLLKGPFTAYPLENCVRVTVGPLCLMKNFWDDCREIITRYALAHPDSLTLESNYGKNS